jgi:hypothetical protein
MSIVQTQGNNVLVDSPDVSQNDDRKYVEPGRELVSWITDRTESWKNHRDRGYSTRWQEYWRMWRGRWSESDRNRLTERSRLIAPALAQAIEASAAEIEEGALAKDIWIDIADDVSDETKEDALVARDLLLEDLDEVNAKDALAEIVLNATIFGTGIAKISVEICKESVPVRNPATGKLENKESDRIRVFISSVRPDEFIPDPSGRNLHEMLGFAHEVTVPVHSVLEKIKNGVYRKEALPYVMGSAQTTTGNEADSGDLERVFNSGESDSIRITEYHGKVPLSKLEDVDASTTPLDELLSIDRKVRPTYGDGELVEAIVTIGNDGVLLRADLTPFTMKDRSFVAFQYEKVPGRFWGRGVAEKGYNPQKALDAEVRSRIDALGFISSPMLGVDSGRVPRGFKMEVKPGKVWKTQGDPNQILRPIEIGNLNQATFNQAGEMERMVQMGTGAFDTASSLGGQSSTTGANAASSNSLMMGAFVKRSKRAIQNFSRNLIAPTIKKVLWRYMQFDPARYPQDYKFRAVGGTGIVAREVEAMQLTQLMGMLPDSFPQVSAVIARGIIDNSSVYNKAEISQAIDAALQPPPPEELEKQQQLADAQLQAALAEAQGKLLDNQHTLAKIRSELAEAEMKARKADVEDEKVQQEQQRIALQSLEIDQFMEQNRIAMERLKLQEKQLDLKARQI